MNLQEALRKIGIEATVIKQERINWRGDAMKDIDDNIIMEKQIICSTRNIRVKSNVISILTTNMKNEVYFLSYNTNTFIVIFKKMGNDIYILQGIKKPLHDHWIVEREFSNKENISKIIENSKEIQKADIEHINNSWEPIKMAISLTR